MHKPVDYRVVVSLLLPFLLTGCATRSPGPVVATTAYAQIRGNVHGGQQPVSNATVQLYAANTTATAGASTPLGSPVTTGSDGSFSITGQYTCPAAASTPVYIAATGGNPGLGAGTTNSAITILAALGPCSSIGKSTYISMNELTTVAAVWAFANSMTDYAHVGSPSSSGLASEFTLASELVNYASGQAPGATLPANAIAPVPKLNTMADILASCVNSDGSGATGNTTPCGKLFTASANGPLPTDIVGAAIGIAANPASNVSTLFQLAGSAPPFQPTLAAAPTNWTMPIATVTWASPAAITYPTPIGSTQLNATASVPGSFTYNPASGTVLGAGSQTLSATFSATDSADYAPLTVTVPLSVSQGTPAITWANPASILYSTPLSGTQLNATASVPGSFVYNPTAGTYLSPGTQSLGVTFTPTDAVDYVQASKTVSIVVSNGTPSYTWNNVQIVGGGYVTGIVAHPTAKNVRYARTDVGGAYGWNQSTNAWVALTDFYSRSNNGYGGCEAIAIDPSDSTRLYLAMGEYAESFGTNGQFLISTNQGASFTTVAAPFKMGSNDNGRTAGERMAVDPNLGTTIYYGSRLNGLWRSTNRGTNWTQVSSFPVTGPTGTSGEGAGVVFVDFVASSGSSGSATPVIYVGVSDTGVSTTGYSSLYRSADAGVTWQAVPGQPTGSYPMRGVIGPDGVLYLAYAYGAGSTTSAGSGAGPGGITTGALYKYVLPLNTTPTGAGVWTNITPGTSARQSGSQGGFASIAVDPEVPGVIMATTLDDYYPGDDIYRSTNGGATWVSVVLKQGATFNTSLAPWVTFGGSSTSTGTWPTSLIIDPFNSSHVMYGTGQTLWDSTNITVSDTGGKATFNIGATGIEETVVQALSSPPSGPALISGVSDLGGFVHTSVTSTPAGGMIENPRLGQISNIDFAQNLPSTFAFVGDSTTGAYSLNSGTSWTPFPTAPSGTTAGNGDIAVSADGTTFVWSPSDAPVAYTTNNGGLWTASTGAIQNAGIVSDRINPRKFYIYSSGTSGNATSTLQISTDGGKTFATAATGLANYSVLAANYTAEGDLWLGSSSTGLYHSTNSGATFTSVAGFSYVYAIGFGKAYSAGGYPAIYLIGQNTGGTYGFFRSIDGGSSFVQINDTLHQWGYVKVITGDPKLFGRVYLSTGGRGIIYGDSQF